MFRRSILLSIRNRAFLLALLLVLSLATTFTPFLSQTASAVSADDILNRARAWSILNTIIDKRGEMKGEISNVDIDSCRFFPNFGNIFVGAPVTGNHDSGGATWADIANNSSILNGALNSVGIDGGCRGLLEDIGYTVTGSGLKKPGDFGDRLSQRIRDSLVDNAFFGANIGDESPGDALSYALMDYHLRNVCGWQYRNPYNPDSSDANEKRTSQEAQANGWSGDNRGRHYYTYTFENNKAGLNVYYKDGGREDDARVGPKTGFASTAVNNAVMDCGDNNADTFGAKLGDNHRYADAYANLLRPGGDTTPGTCADRYAGKDAELNACDAGFKNKNDPAFCTTTYPNDAPQREACQYGQGTATGGKDATTPPPGTGDNEEGNDKTTCAIEGIGWIICPAVTFLAKITDAAWAVVDGFLSVSPLSVTNDSGLFKAWAIMRNFANVAFVVFFLVIIFSQLSSVGITNYGIKKLLPKLVVAAILVNVSYWICAIAVDISNILGGSLKELFEGIQAGLGEERKQFSWAETSSGILGGALIAGGAGAVLFFTTLSVLLPMLVVVLATIVTVFLTLVLRQVLIIVLIVLSPLAFVAYLLPNTESFTKKWRTAFQLLLLIYPLIALVFGAGALASTIIMQSSQEIYIQIAGAAAAIIPLVVIPALVSGINKLANQYGISTPNVKLGGLRKRAEGFRDTRKEIATTKRLRRAQGVLGGSGRALGEAGSRRRRLAAFVAGTGASYGLNKEQKEANAKRALSEQKQQYVVDRAGATDTATDAQKKASQAYATAIAGPTGDVEKIIASAKDAAIQQFNKEVSAEKATMSRSAPTELSEIMQNTSGNESSARRAAAAGQLMKNGSDKDIFDTLSYLGTSDSQQDPALRDIQQQVGADIGNRKPVSLGASDVSKLNSGTYSGTGNFESRVGNRLANGKLSAAKLAGASADEVKEIKEYVRANATALKSDVKTAAALKALENDINQYRSNKNITQPSHDISSQMDEIHGLL